MTAAAAPTGCPFVVGKVKKWDRERKQYDLASVFCHKLPEKDSAYCPRHKLVADELAKHQQRVEQHYQTGG
jgi:hypothetical protein